MRDGRKIDLFIVFKLETFHDPLEILYTNKALWQWPFHVSRKACVDSSRTIIRLSLIKIVGH